MIRRPPLTFVVALLAGCAGPGIPAEMLEAAMPDLGGTRVEVATLRPSEAVIRVSLPGEVTGSQDALLASALGGLVEAVFVDEGDAVRKGRALVEVDQDIYAAQVAQAEAQLTLAQQGLGRAQQMGDLATGAELDGLKAQVTIAEAQLRIARTQLERAVVRAPFEGIVGGVAVDPGEMAGPGAPVVRLVALDPVKVSLSVSDRDVVALRPGLEARVTTSASTGVRTGRIASVAPVADLSTRSFLVEVEVPNPERTLLPGMIARVEIDRTVGGAGIAIPQDHIVTKLDGYGVFVVEDAVARWRPVKLGEVVRGTIVVQEGLAVGDRLVTVGQHGLVDGDAVVIAREGWCCEDGRAVFDATTAQAQ